MIKATDLRIGNKVLRVKTNSIFTITAIDISTIANDDLNVEPIPLTHEILEKCGFEYLNYYECYFIKTQTGEILLSNEYILQSTDTLTQLKYLHQLQNLFYCLCGKELDITFS